MTREDVEAFVINNVAAISLMLSGIPFSLTVEYLHGECPVLPSLTSAYISRAVHEYVSCLTKPCNEYGIPEYLQQKSIDDYMHLILDDGYALSTAVCAIQNIAWHTKHVVIAFNEESALKLANLYANHGYNWLNQCVSLITSSMFTIDEIPVTSIKACHEHIYIDE